MADIQGITNFIHRYIDDNRNPSKIVFPYSLKQNLTMLINRELDGLLEDFNKIIIDNLRIQVNVNTVKGICVINITNLDIEAPIGPE